MKYMKHLIGEPAAYEMLAEECVEMAHAALKMARIYRGENPTPADIFQTKTKLIEEVSDVCLCMYDLNLEPNTGIQAAKLERFRERMRKKLEGDQ